MRTVQVALTVGLLLLFIPMAVYRYLPEGAEPLPVISAAPAFSLMNADEQPVNAADLKGNVWVMSFFFTRCAGICPAVNGRLAKLSNKFSDKKDFRMLSVSVDPEQDTPQVLREYRAKFRTTNPRWEFLRTEMPELKSLMTDGLKLASMDDPNLHTTSITLVDKNGQIRGYYRGLDAESMEKLESDIDALITE